MSVRRPLVALAALVALAVLSACAGKRLPPGTPPPEYESRVLEPWAGDALDAGVTEPPPAEPTPPGTDQAAPGPTPPSPPKSDPAPLDAGAGPSPDAGVR